MTCHVAMCINLTFTWLSLFFLLVIKNGHVVLLSFCLYSFWIVFGMKLIWGWLYFSSTIAGRVDRQQLEYEGSLAEILFLIRSLAFNLLNFHFDMFAYSVGRANAKSTISSRNSRLADLVSGFNIENSIPALCFYYALCV